MKLKTLKDLNVLHRARSKDGEFYNHKFPFKDIEFCWTNQLKQEAIKHIKEIKQEIRKIQTNNFNLPYQPTPEEWLKCDVLLSKIHWIKHFFNISEEDLK